MLYSPKVFMPTLTLPSGEIRLTYSDHAIKAFISDKHFKPNMDMPTLLDLSKCSIIEVETNDNKKVIKVVYRTPNKNNKDLVLAVKFTPKPIVKTVWFNDSSDHHATLDKNRYSRK